MKDLSINRVLDYCRRDFPSLGLEHNGHPVAYFDGPAGTQVPQTVIDAVAWYYSNCNANTHGQFVTSRLTDRCLQETRKTVAAFLNSSSSDEISFGANMTTLNFSLSRAIEGQLAPGDEVLITQLDHEANRGPWLRLRNRGITVREIKLGEAGALDYEDFVSKVNERTRLVAMGLASNALGTVNDVGLARKITRQVGAYLLVDAVHYAPHFPLDVEAIDADFLLCSAYKFYGPHVGLLYTRKGLLEQLNPERLRTQSPRAPERIETGTLNHAALAGVKAAIEYLASFGTGDDLRERIASAMSLISRHEASLAHYFCENLRSMEGIHIYGPGVGTARRAPTISFTVRGVHPARVTELLGDQGLFAWDGDFYAARPVELLGLARKGGLVRVGMSMYSQRQEVDRLLEAISRIAQQGPKG